MKKIFTLFCVIACMSFFCMPAHASVAPATQFENVDDYGFLRGIDGTDWTYTIKYTYTNYDITGVDIDIYDSNNALLGKINETFELKETDIRINNVAINPTVTKRFFNGTTANIEVMLFAYVATKDYKGRYFNNVYALSVDGSTLQCTIPGNMVLAENLSPTKTSENYVMTFFHIESVKDSITGLVQDIHYYEVYEKAAYGETKPKLTHTFAIPYDNIKALNDPTPFAMVQNNGKMNYFITQYEKPYFVPGTSVYEDPIINENNAMIITQYDNKFNVIGETKIPMVKDPDKSFLYTFYQVGSLGGERDIMMDFNGTGKPVYVVTHDNYETSSDGTVKSYYLYDADGNKINTIAEKVKGTVYLSDIEGQSIQYAFLMSENNKEFIRFVDVPSCEVVAEIDLYNNGSILSNNIDRVAKGNAYQYVISLLQGDSQKDGSTVQRIAWFNKDGSLSHYDSLNLGKGVELAQVNIDGALIHPHVFITDDAYEYLALVKRTQVGTSAKEEVLVLVNNEGKIIEEWKALNGNALSFITVNNLHSHPTLVCTYTNGPKFVIQFYPLPLITSPLKGEGTIENPYQIACFGDFIQIEKEPNACYKVVNHIDFCNIPFAGLKTPFMGKLDGNNFAFHNLYLEHGGLFNEVIDSAVIENLFLEQPTMTLYAQDNASGFIANSIRGGANDLGVNSISIMRNIHIIEPTINAHGFTSIVGGLAGEASYYTQITECSVTDALFDAVNAEEMGGIAGQLSTATSVNAAVVTGQLQGGKTVGGIAATIGGGENITNCHVNAGLMGSKTIGGIVGASERSIISNCFAEGTITLRSDRVGELGGILGRLEEDVLKTDTTIRVKNCLVDVLIFYELEEGETIAAHRIVGSTRVDQFEYDWDNIDYNKPQSEWPKIYGDPELCLANNYVIGDIDVIDNTIAAAHNTTEGETLAATALTTEWLAQHGFALGANIDAPWVMGEALHLWFEGADSTLDIEGITTTPLVNMVNGTLQAEGAITVYNLNGMVIAQGMNTINMQSLNAGVYIVSVNNNSAAATCKVLIP